MNTVRGTGLLSQAIRKYGAQAFDLSIVDTTSSEEESYMLETLWIARFQSNDKDFGYNMNEGGEGGRSPSHEVRLKMSNSHLGHQKTEIWKTRLKESNTPEKQPHWKLTPEIRERIQLLRSTGLSLKKIASMVNLSVTSVRRAI